MTFASGRGTAERGTVGVGDNLSRVTPMRTDLAAKTAPPAAKPRRAWMDNLRIVLISGVIVAHAATAYVVDVGWYYEERTTSELTQTVLSFPVFLGGIFGLGPLLVMAGWLSVSSLRRRGTSGFVRARLVRLGVPLLLFLSLIHI